MRRILITLVNSCAGRQLVAPRDGVAGGEGVLEAPEIVKVDRAVVIEVECLPAGGSGAIGGTRNARFVDVVVVQVDLAVVVEIAQERGRAAVAHQDDLVQPLRETQPAPFAYWIVCPKADAEAPNIARFRDWLIEEAATDAANMPAPGETIAAAAD